MFKITTVTLIALCSVGSLGCSGKDGKDGKNGKNSGASAIEISAEMKGFVGGMGTSDKVEASLKKYGAEGLDAKGMEMYDLKDPKVTAKSGDCFDFEAKAGMTTRTYAVCWKAGKIEKVESKGMK